MDFLTVGKRLGRGERDKLYELLEDEKVGYRAKIVLLSYEGYTAPEIEKRLNVHVKNVRKWIKRFNEDGVAGILEAKRQGRKPIFDRRVENRIVEIATTNPIHLGLPFSTWSLRKLAYHLTKKGVVKKISHAEVRRILNDRDVAFRKSKRKLFSEDPEYEAKKARIQRLLRKPNCVVLYVDEKGPIPVKEYGGYSWCRRTKIIRANQKIKGKVSMFTAYDLHSDKLYAKFYHRETSEEFVKFVSWISGKFGDKAYLIMDNATIHTSKMSRRAMKLLKNLSPVFLPTNAPELNPLEGKFSELQREALDNRKFGNVSELVHSLNGWMKFHNGERKKIGSRYFVTK